MRKDLMLVTGANGYVGMAIVDLLVQAGVPVRAMVRNPKNADALKRPGVEVVIADLQDKESLRAAVSGVWGIFHIGAIFRQAGLPEEVFYDINAEGTRRLFDVAIEAGVKRIIHCSTGGVLGHIANPPGNESSPYNPGDMYQRSKLEGEKIAMEYFRSGKMGGVVIRPAMIYGPGDTRNLKLFRMIACVVRSRRGSRVGGAFSNRPTTTTRGRSSTTGHSSPNSTPTKATQTSA